MATRVNQRARTRQAIVEAAGALLDDGNANPSIDEVAERARVSRATVYRYFESASDIVWQAFTDRAIPGPDETVALAGDDVRDRVQAALDVVNGYLLGDADGTRAFERAMLDRRLTGKATRDDRPGRRLRYIDAALEPVADRLSEAELRRVRAALALTMGSHVVGAMLDTCHLDPDEAREVTAFAARAIVEAAERMEKRAAPAAAST